MNLRLSLAYNNESSLALLRTFLLHLHQDCSDTGWAEQQKIARFCACTLAKLSKLQDSHNHSIDRLEATADKRSGGDE